MAIIESNTNFADQIVCTTANQAVIGDSNVTSDAGFILTAHPGNTALVWMYENAVGKTKDNGYPLAVGDALVVGVSRLSRLKFEAEANGQKVCWIKR